jgi:transcriptional regulator with XRE-family HTH domain
MKTASCSNCGGLAEVLTQNHEFTEMGIPVVLQKIKVIRCSDCGNEDPIIPNMDGLMHILAVAVVCCPSKLSGAEVRFLRKYAGKSAREFARFLHVDHTHLSKVENGKTEIGTRLDKLVRLLVVNMSPTLRDEIKKLLDMMPDIDDSCDEEKGIEIDPATQSYQYA